MTMFVAILNFYKYPITILLKSTDVDQDQIMKFYGTYFGTDRCGLTKMFKAR